MSIKAIRRWLRNLTWMPFNRKFTAHNMFLRTVVREYGIPFELKLDVPQETAAEAALESKKMLSDLSERKSSNEETMKG